MVSTTSKITINEAAAFSNKRQYKCHLDLWFLRAAVSLPLQKLCPGSTPFGSLNHPPLMVYNKGKLDFKHTYSNKCVNCHY